MHRDWTKFPIIFTISPFHITELTYADHISVVELANHLKNEKTLASRSQDGERACEGYQDENIENEEYLYFVENLGHHIHKVACIFEDAKEPEYF